MYSIISYNAIILMIYSLTEYSVYKIIEYIFLCRMIIYILIVIKYIDIVYLNILI